MLTTIIVYSVMTFATVMVADFTQGLINLWGDCWRDYHLRQRLVVTRPLTTYVTSSSCDRAQDTDQVSDQNFVQTVSATKKRGRPRKAA